VFEVLLRNVFFRENKRNNSQQETILTQYLLCFNKNMFFVKNRLDKGDETVFLTPGPDNF
jgi:hypothetical protein